MKPKAISNVQVGETYSSGRTRRLVTRIISKEGESERKIVFFRGLGLANGVVKESHWLKWMEKELRNGKV